MSLKPEYKIIADHLRSSCFLIADGVFPSNEGRGYVLRRIIRRSVRQIHKLGAKNLIMHQLVDSLIEQMGQQYPEIARGKNLISETLKNEEEKFRETLEKGLKILDEEINIILQKKSTNHKLSGEIAFKLYDTYGFPLDLTQTICEENNLTVDSETFENEMNLQRQRARKSWLGSGEISEDKLFYFLKENLGETEFLYHQTTKSTAKILAIYHNLQPLEKISANIHQNSANSFIILDKTPFYATSGGQKGDDGNLILATEMPNHQDKFDYKQLNNIADIYETKKYAGNLFIHYISDLKGELKVGDEVYALVNNRHRQLRAQNHSATHLLHKSLKQILGNSIAQKGSNVDVKQLTFDFNLNRAMTLDEIEEVEEMVNFYIRQNSPIDTKEMALDEARNIGAEALFGEKYEDKVRVVAMGPSIELCGGTHVYSTGNIGIFKIISENGIASGIRRITAKTGFYAWQHLKLQEQKLNMLLDSLKVKQQFDDVKIDDREFLSNKVGFNDISFFSNEDNSKIINQSQHNNINLALKKTAQIGEDLLQNLKDKDKEILQLKQQIWHNILANITTINLQNISFAQHVFKNVDSKDLREITLLAKTMAKFSQNNILAFFALKDDKVSLCLSVSNDLTAQFDAAKLITPMIEAIAGKGGGGKKDLAMGGGSDASKVNHAIDILKNFIAKT